MAEHLLSEFDGFREKYVQKEILEEVDNIDVMNKVEDSQNKYQSQAGSKKLKSEEEVPQNTCIDDLPNELLQLILKNLEFEDVVTR